MKAHCLFEQSGTFKREFKKLGIDAVDYDILNDYGETDRQIDLFHEIEKSYEGGASVFDEMTKDDVLMAFFPCTMFEEHNAMFFRGDLWQQKNHTAEKKLEDAIDRHETLHEFYTLVCKLFLVCLRKGLRLVVENPYSQPHYLTLYFPIKPALIDNDRRNNGDKMKKPTQFWFVNFEPKRNLVFEPITYKPVVNVETIKGAGVTRRRSEIEGEYASRFIRQFIL